MRIIFWLMALLASLYGGYWFIGSSAVEKGAISLFDDLRDDGFEVDYQTLLVRGFPSRFDTTLTEPYLRDPNSGIGWSAPFFQIFALSYLPNKVILIFPNTQTIYLPGQTLTVTSQKLRASAGTGFASNLPLREITFEAPVAALASDAGWQIAAVDILAAFRAAGSDPNAYDFYLGLDEIALPEPLRRLLDPQGQRPELADLFRFDAQVVLTKPLNRNAGSGAPPQIVSLNFRNLQFRWADIDFSVRGDLQADPFGYAIGTLTVTVRNWRELIEMARRSGLLSAQEATLYERSFAPLSVAEGTTEVVSTVLTFENGEIKLGFFSLGVAPKLR